jgi:hypothetical protein
VRQLILSIDATIGEGIYWNAPIFYFTGKMSIFDVKENKRYIVGFVFNKKNSIRMVLLHGTKLIDQTALLECDYIDGRRLITFTSLEDVIRKESDFIDIIKQLIKTINY